MNHETPTPPSGSDPDRPSINWLAFWLTLLAPATLTILTFAFFRSKADADAALIWIICGSIVVGIACGIMLGRRLGRSLGTKILLSVLFAFLLGAVSFVISCFGCMMAFG